MFLIGLIVGMLGTIGLGFAGLAVCCKIAGVTWREFDQASDVVATALENRESSLEVWHDGELINGFTFEEK